jgi:hypothetical protein
MATKKRNSQTLVLDLSQAADADLLDTPDYAGNTTTTLFSDEVDASLCPSCGEPLAWHEEACSAPATPSPAQDKEAPDTSADAPGPTSSRFAYVLGQAVQPAPSAQAHTIVWRGQVKERHPRTGLIYRVNVYRLSDGFWDCYFEADLQAA